MRMTLEDKYKFKELDNRIRNGELEAMFEYAWLYQDKFSELITSAIADKMVEYYTACVEAGNMTAALNLGAMYYGGEHILQDYKKAIGLYEMATQSDDYGTKVRAWCNLGYCYYYGRDIPVDDEKAFNCYMHAVLLRDANALYKIGDMYRYGRYVSKDENMAMEFYRQAWNEVQDGTPPYADICKRIGECALYGIGMEKDALLAVRMLARAESSTYEKISERDPFAYSLLPKIQKMLGEAKALVEKTLEIDETSKAAYDEALIQCKNMKLSKIFEEKPEGWGLRGDPYFWDYLKKLAEDMDIISPDKLEKWIKEEYFTLSGKALTDKYTDFAVIEQFAHGGMSSGCVDNGWWIEEGIPLLKSRLTEL